MDRLKDLKLGTSCKPKYIPIADDFKPIDLVKFYNLNSN
jgi:hypothetical protein